MKKCLIAGCKVSVFFFIVFLIFFLTPLKAQDTANYFPLTVGTQWTYKRTVSNGQETQVILKVTGEKEITSTTVSILQEQESSLEKAFAVVGGELRLYGFTDPFSKEFVTIESPTPYEIMGMFPYVKEQKVPLTVYTLSNNRKQVFQVETLGEETVSVPAGTFENACKIRYSASMPAAFMNTVWFVKDMGIVKFEMQYPKQNVSILDELVEMKRP